MTTKNWTVERNINDYGINSRDRNGAPAQIAGYIESLRTARMMAASPELLDAARALLAVSGTTGTLHTDLGGVDLGHLRRTVDRIDAARRR